MHIASIALVILVAIEHMYFLVLEMFLWTTPFGLKTFGQTLEHAQISATLAMNQGLYNGFLAAGLFWSLLARDASAAYNLKIFFLSCVLVAAIFGGATVGPKILLVQGAPALLSLGLVWFARRSS